MTQKHKALLKEKIAAIFAAIAELDALIVSDDYEWANNLEEDEDEDLASSLNNSLERQRLGQRIQLRIS